MRGRLASICFTAIVMLLSGCGSEAPLKVGFIGGLSGRFSDLGTSGRNGAIVAVDWRNARGGVNGRPVTLLIRDDEQNPHSATRAFQSLLAEDAVAIVGPMTSSIATTLTPLAEREKIVLMGGTIVTNQLSGKDDYLLRVISDASVYATQTARHLESIAAGESTVVVYDLANRDYSEDWARAYAAEAARIGNRSVTLLPFDSRSVDSRLAIADRVFTDRDKPPQRLVLVCASRDAVAVASAARLRHPSIGLAAAAWAGTEQMLEEGGPRINGMVVQLYHNVDDSGESFRSFSGEYVQRFGRRPDYAAVIAFEAMNVLLDGLERNPKRAGLREAILAHRQFSGLSGMITLDATGDAIRPYFAAVVKNGRYVALPSPPR